jgi:hypothetical protein
MSARLTRVEFADQDEFELAPRFGREFVEERFSNLKDSMLNELLTETEVVNLDQRLRLAANEAAGLAWTTEFPLLVFPGLFAELARKERVIAGRQARVTARTEMILENV